MQEPQYPAYEDTTRAPTPSEYENRINPQEPRMDLGQGTTPQPCFIPELNEEARLHPDQRHEIVSDDDILRAGEARLENEQATGGSAGARGTMPATTTTTTSANERQS